jgi:tetratricopeptide (TPR) repeat protein
MLREAGRLDESFDCGRRGVELFEALLRNRPEDPDLLVQMGGGCTNLSVIALNSGRPAESVDLAERAIAIQEKLVAANPSVTNYRAYLADAYRMAGYAREELGRLDEAARDYHRATELAEGLLAVEPTSTYARTLLAQGLLYESWLLIRAGRLDRGLPLLRRAQGLQEQVVRDHPRVVKHTFNLAFVCRALGRAEEQAGRPDEAYAAFDRARQIDEAEAGTMFMARYNEACDLALMARVAPPDRRERLADRAMEALRRCIAQGYRSYSAISTDPDLNALRGRPDLQSLLSDLAMPADPFARAD